MKWTTLSLLAGLALLGNACERHSAEETKAALHHGDHGDHGAHDTHAAPGAGAGHDAHATPSQSAAATENRNSAGESTRPDAPFAPTGVATNPAGSGPTDPNAAKRKTDGPDDAAKAPQFFPEGKK